MEEKKSVFIASCKQVINEEEAQAFLRSRRNQKPDARHHVYAWLVGGAEGQRLQRFSDDGEPQGTSGPPVLDVLVRRNIMDTIIVVTRYFGGILLGTGGLVKAYGTAASGVIAEAGLVCMVPGWRYKIRFPYRFVDTLQYQLGLAEIEVSEKSYGSDVTFHCLVETQKEEVFRDLVRSCCLGQADTVRETAVSLPRKMKEETDGNQGES